MAAWRSAGGRISVLAIRFTPLPRLAGVTSPRQRWLGGENTVIAGEVNPWLRYEGCQAGDEIDRVEGHLGRSIAVGRLQGVDHLAGGAE